MKQTNENVVQNQDTIELGIASVETQGNKPVGEEIGGNRSLGISDE
ncbi:benenodin family lasso peptide [Stenotrophomonas maltophilia]|nr:benenodin family lasso peptide [Stenotrophomonas maltophilia]MCO7486971.1 benenodin family lasso peptide [Stenotrophomonas maltophilia]